MPGAAKRKQFVALLMLALAGCAVFAALGIWQVHRLAWKEALIARVDARIHAAPQAVPGPSAWSGITAQSAEYRRVYLNGQFRSGPATLVKAVTERGPGFWVLAPFDEARGFTVLVNRGFVADRSMGNAPPPLQPRRITGLLRMSEPGGAFLQSNQPAANRWFSRDVEAIARARGLTDVAPYFVDQAAGENGAGGPVGGLTVIRFPNNHLAYAITWFALTAMSLFAAIWLIRERVRPTAEQ